MAAEHRLPELEDRPGEPLRPADGGLPRLHRKCQYPGGGCVNCLCCGKSLKEPLTASGWHPACIRRFFGTTTFPAIELTDETLILLTDESVQRGYTVPGIQKKLPLHLSAGNSPRLTPAD